MNNFVGSPDFARMIARLSVQDRVNDAKSRTRARKARRRAR
jgi:hypothetical protein